MTLWLLYSFFVMGYWEDYNPIFTRRVDLFYSYILKNNEIK